MTNGSQKRKQRAAQKHASDAQSGTTRPAGAAPKQATAPVRTGVQTLTVEAEEAGMRLDRWFKRRFPGLALSHLAKIARKGEVRVDGKRVDTATRLEEGNVVRVPPLTLEAPAAPAVKRINPEDAAAIRRMTLYEDKHVLVLNKPFGLAVQGGSGTKHHIDGMLASLADEKGNRPVLVHRLDRDTCGVLLIAKNRKIAAELGETFRSRKAQKIYWALVEGVPKPSQGRISLYLAKGPGMGDDRGPKPRRGEIAKTTQADREKMRVAKHGEEDAQHSLTYYAIVDKIAPKCAWLSMKPLTGRTHQLRAHAEAIGHPIFGDPKYGRDDKNPDHRRRDAMHVMPENLDRKLHLLARRLVLPHPAGGVIDVTAPLPEHMQKTWDMFGFDTKQYDPIVDAPEE